MWTISIIAMLTRSKTMNWYGLGLSLQNVIEYDQEIPLSHNANQPLAT